MCLWEKNHLFKINKKSRILIDLSWIFFSLKKNWILNKTIEFDFKYLKKDKKIKKQFYISINTYII